MGILFAVGLVGYWTLIACTSYVVSVLGAWWLE